MIFKKIAAFAVMALLCLNFKTQAQENKAVDVTAKGIQIGQKVPDVLITNLHNYKDKSGKPATTAKLSDFKGKLLILDFWATWCSPCVVMIPKMDSLQRVFGDKIQFLSVTYQTEKEVLPFLKKLEKNLKTVFLLPLAISDTTFRQLFPHKALPHYVWIDDKGTVKAITNYEEVTANNINALLNNTASLARKKDFKLDYNPKKPFLLNANGGDGANLIYHSVLTGYTQGLIAGNTYDRLDTTRTRARKISCWNKSISALYRIAFQEDNSHISMSKMLLQVSDTLKVKGAQAGRAFLAWQPSNTYCYELIVPPSQSDNMFAIMRQELGRLFPQYVATLEKITRKCLTLVRTSNIDKIKTKGGKPFGDVNQHLFSVENAELGYLISRLERMYLSKYPHPIIDGTGYAHKVDLDIAANLANIIEINKALKAYDLAFVEKEMTVESLVIREKKMSHEKL